MEICVLQHHCVIIRASSLKQKAATSYMRNNRFGKKKNIYQEMDLTDFAILPSYLTAFSRGIIRVITVERIGGTSTLRVI
ncbi:hypothetical protein PUN28_018032 [Cardiocondyla obscurior]|uniref:Uncharacterized protein n=1 Tax=Cardiocondyla obscurior TaxID=286306 RepID=A0AAW2EHM1_9HYME